MYKTTVGRKTFQFENLATLLGKASPLRSGDQAGWGDGGKFS